VSKNFPLTARKYDLYVALDEAVEVGRVLFAGRKRRFVIKELMSREAWDAERAIPPQGDPKGRWLGPGKCDDKPNDESLSYNPSAGIPEECKFFYGADYLPQDLRTNPQRARAPGGHETDHRPD